MDDATFKIISDKIVDIRTNPTRHHHTWADMYDCCKVNRVLNLDLADAHTRYAPVRIADDGTVCDVIEGSCSCGVTHEDPVTIG